MRTTISLSRFVAAAAWLTFGSATPTWSCVIVDGFERQVGETQEDYELRSGIERRRWREHVAASSLRRQIDIWSKADTVLLARVDGLSSFQLPGHGEAQRRHLKSVAALKGRSGQKRFTLSYTEATTCGPGGGGDAATGNVGDRFIVYLRQGRPGNRTLIDSISVDRIRDPRLTGLLSSGR